jgi:hypothetical protein
MVFGRKEIKKDNPRNPKRKSQRKREKKLTGDASSSPE